MDLRPINVEESLMSPGSGISEISSPGVVPLFYAPVSGNGLVNATSVASPWYAGVPIGYPTVNAAVGFSYNPNFTNRAGGGNGLDLSSAVSPATGYLSNSGSCIGGVKCLDKTGNDAADGLGCGALQSYRVIDNTCDQVGNIPPTGMPYSLTIVQQATGNGADQASEEGGDDSVSGKKIKFLCSYGGKILPRPSDGMLRYVGGQTRIISFRRDVSFNELAQKMADTYGQPVVIKYQLPNEDFDALISVSCPDDLENMLDEYAKLIEQSPDGSAKLRIFLFSASELDAASGMIQIGDLHNSGQRYVEAVNGITDGISGGIPRKQSVASAASTQNSDLSATEVLDNSIRGHGEISRVPSSSVLSPTGNLAASHDNVAKLVIGDHRPVACSEDSVVPLGISTVTYGPTHTSSFQNEVVLERSAPITSSQQQIGLQQSRMDIPPSAPYLQPLFNPYPDVMNRADYVHPPPQVGFLNPQPLGKAGHVFTQQQFYVSTAGLASNQVIPTMHVTMATPSSHVDVRSNVLQSVLQPQKNHLVQYTDESNSGSRTAFQVQVPPTVAVGNFGGVQVPPQEHPIFLDGLSAHQPVMIPEKIQTVEDCYMCQKTLPHAHSDPVAQDQQDSSPATSSDFIPSYHILPMQENLKAMETNRVMMTAPLKECVIEQGNGTRPKVVSKMEPLVGVPFTETAELSHNLERLPEQDGHSALMGITPISLDVVQQSMLPNENYFKQDVLQNKGSPTSLSPSGKLGDVQDSSNSLFSNKDPWNMHHEACFPPPRPNKVPLKKETSSSKNYFAENLLVNNEEQSPEAQVEDTLCQPFKHNLILENGSTEDQIKRELKVVAEGVAASVLQSSTPSNPDLNVGHVSGHENIEDGDVQNNVMDVQAKAQDVKIKPPEMAYLGFPVSDGLGRLQVIKNCDLEELRELGSGTFGTVYHGKWRGTDVAIKRINDRCFAGKPSEQERLRADFWNEAINLADLHHPNVVAFYGVVLDGPGGSVATVTEYMVNGSLKNALQKNERNLDRRKLLLIAMDVAFGMEYLHGKNIVHFDLKSDNLLVNLRDPHRPICKVGDLGLSKAKHQTLISGGVRGTLPWMAPELLNGSSNLVSEKVDVFSFGIVMWEVITGEEPYANLHYGTIIGGILNNTLRPPVPESCDPEWKSLMERCWSSEASQRPSFTEIANQLRSMAAKIPPKVQTQQQQLA
ncbi:hypothetical protein L6164_011481 [Bauhinia variegata]|uniref:Uncharacterized protein n=1 Tax=Bauhinia variegata TaxID=167791 RepID=A0ACB9P7D4_BAUVA|nr:hypothetical protein L6164_011481 [Bauhinia variegata]